MIGNALPFLPGDGELQSSVSGTLRVVGAYLVLGVLWIIFSDRALGLWFDDPGQIGTLQMAKGVAFVALSAAFIAIVVYRELGARAESVGQIRTLVDQNLAGITVVRDGRFLFVNSRLAEIFAYGPDDLIGKVRVLDLVAPEDRELVEQKIHERMDGEIDYAHYRYTGLTKDGESVRVEAFGRRITWQGHAAVLSLHLDVTEEESLREQARRAQRMESLGQLVGQVAHDFNNLLTAVVVSLESCEAELDPESPVAEDLRDAREASRRGVTLTRQLLSFSRQRLYHRRPIDLSELVRNMESLIHRLTGSGVDVQLDLSEDLPAVEVDPSQFEQVLLNLVTNAMDAVDGEGTIEIATGVDGNRDLSSASVFLEVSDDGKGMDAATRRQIFEPYFTTRQEGTGLGLAIIHGIIKQAKGDISVESKPDDGATFRIRLPASELEPAPLSGVEEAHGEADVRELPLLSRKRILVVEDQEPVLRVTARALERHGFGTLSASSGEEALEVVGRRRHEIDLILTDVGLPDMNGLQLSCTIAEMDPDIPVAFMSGRSNVEVLDQLAGRSDLVFLEKPFSISQLMAAVHRALTPDSRTGTDG